MERVSAPEELTSLYPSPDQKKQSPMECNYLTLATCRHDRFYYTLLQAQKNLADLLKNGYQWSHTNWTWFGL